VLAPEGAVRAVQTPQRVTRHEDGNGAPVLGEAFRHLA
jgi:hypothetical protein